MFRDDGYDSTLVSLKSYDCEGWRDLEPSIVLNSLPIQYSHTRRLHPSGEKYLNTFREVWDLAYPRAPAC